jgi:hypothetical protein
MLGRKGKEPGQVRSKDPVTEGLRDIRRYTGAAAAMCRYQTRSQEAMGSI